MKLLDRWGLGLCAIGLTLAQPVAAAVADIAKTLSLPVAGGLVGAHDKARFAWVTNEAGVRNIWIADEGKPAHPLTAFTQDDGLEIYDLEFTRDGSALAFVRGGDAEFPDLEDLPNAAAFASWPRQQVLVSALDGSAPLSVGDGHSPTFSRDGTQLAFTYRGTIYLWQRGGGTRPIAKAAGEVSNLQWSPDGSSLLFVDNRENHSFVALLDIAAGQIRYFQPELGNAIEPVFSPDGKRIAFIFFVEPPMGAAPTAALIGRYGSPMPLPGPPTSYGRPLGARARATWERADRICTGVSWARSSYLGRRAAGSTPMQSTRTAAPHAN